MLGGLFNALIAPLVFASLVEYPLVMVLACVLAGARRRGGGRARARARLGTRRWRPGRRARSPSSSTRSSVTRPRRTSRSCARVLGLGRDVGRRLARSARAAAQQGADLRPAAGRSPVFLRRRPLAPGRWPWPACSLVAGFVDARNDDQIRQAAELLRRRSGSPATASEEGYTELRHGTTLHGRQSLDPDAARPSRSPTTTARAPSASSSPSWTGARRRARMAVIGLGTGTLAAYARPGRRDDVLRDRSPRPRHRLRPRVLHLRRRTRATAAARCAWSWATRASAWTRCGGSGPGERYD